MLLLSIIILSYNTRESTIKCINSIFKEYKEELEENKFEIILVDNASTDATASVISNLKSQISTPIKSGSNLRLITNKKNYGFSKGINIGAKFARGKYLLFLNSDTQVKNNGLLGMTQFLQNNDQVGILGGALEAGNFYTFLNFLFMRTHFYPKKGRYVDWVSGASMMIRRDIFNRLSGFDEKFFMYMEDMELCYRARRLGILTYYYPELAISHKGQGSSNREFAILNIYKNVLYFYKKHMSNVEYLLVKTLLIGKAIVAIFIGKLTGNNYLASTYKKALSLSL